MSSATPKYPDAFRVGVQQQDRTIQRILRKGLSPRQQELNRAWSYVCAEQYAACKVDWSGTPVVDAMEHETIARTAVIPPGFYNASAFDNVPLQFRKPRAPYHAVRLVNHKFTSLLFSQRTHPKVEVDGEPETQSWIEQLLKTSRFWVRFAQARRFGGGMGSVMMTFRFRDGMPIIEVHDSRWCTPVMRDVTTGEVESVEIRYMYPDEIRDDAGVLHELWFWYRRIIDEETDTIFEPVLVEEGDEPEWVPHEITVHNLGEFPGVWIRNTETDDIDGETDCHGTYDTADEIDALLSQASVGAMENSDPTLHIADDNELDGAIRKGSKNAIKTQKGGELKYVEMTGSGVEAALKVAEQHRRNFLEVNCVVLDNDQALGGPAMTATEIERRREAMHDRGDSFREQYGETGVKPMIEKMLRAVQKLAAGISVGGEIKIATFKIPGDIGVIAKRGVDTPLQIELKWPPWTKPGPADTSAAASAASMAVMGKVLSTQDAATYVAPYFNIEDPGAAFDRLQAEQQQAQDAMTAQLLAAARGPEPMPPGGGVPSDRGRPPNAGAPGGASPPKAPAPKHDAGGVPGEPPDGLTT